MTPDPEPDVHATIPSPAVQEQTPSWPLLSATEARVLGALIEKSLTTPDYYPLTLNALVAACNQKNNRDPVTALDDLAIQGALDLLREKKLAWQVFLAGNRVPKYRHAFTDVYHVPEEAVPLLCELLLRGPQTAAELRNRSERMRSSPVAEETEQALQALASHREGPFVVRLARESGRRECRYAQLLCGPVAQPALESSPAPIETQQRPPDGSAIQGRLDELARSVAALQARLDALEGKLAQVL